MFPKKITEVIYIHHLTSFQSIYIELKNPINLTTLSRVTNRRIQVDKQVFLICLLAIFNMKIHNKFEQQLDSINVKEKKQKFKLIP